MKRQLVIDAGPFETRLALLEDGKLVEYTGIDNASPAPEMFYRGKVLRVEPSMDAAFVDIGEAQPGFLPRAGHTYRQGDLCLVQIEAIPATETKGVRLTDAPLLTGTYMILRPGQSGVRVSRKLSDSRQRAAKTFAESRCPKGYGMIVRTAWQELGNEPTSFDREIQRLSRLFETAESRFRTSVKPGRLTDSPEILERCLSLLSDPEAEIFVNRTDLYETLLEEQSVRRGGATLHDESRRGSLIFDPFQIDGKIEQALHRKLWLKSGGFLVVDYAEAFTIYDVNSGKDIRKLPPEEKAYAVNLEAVQAVLAHIRLCNIGGIILVDLIDMNSQEKREALLAAVREAAGADHGNVHEEGITSLGILQLTRRRTGLPLYLQVLETCHHCQGTGRHQTARHIEADIRRTVARRLQSGEQCAYRIKCQRDVQTLIRQDPFFESVEFTLQTDRECAVEPLIGSAGGEQTKESN